MPARKLRAVAKPAKDEVKADEKTSVADALAAGDRRAVLVALRERTAAAIDDPKCHPRDLPTLCRQLDGLIHQIEWHDIQQQHGDDEDY
jgi:hypothetical protein